MAMLDLRNGKISRGVSMPEKQDGESARMVRRALRELVEACEYVKPFAGAVAVKASVKDIRQAGRFVKAVEIARAALNEQKP